MFQHIFTAVKRAVVARLSSKPAQGIIVRSLGPLGQVAYKVELREAGFDFFIRPSHGSAEAALKEFLADSNRIAARVEAALC